MSTLAISRVGSAGSSEKDKDKSGAPVRRPGSSRLLTAAGRAATGPSGTTPRSPTAAGAAAAASVTVPAYSGVSGAAGYAAYPGYSASGAGGSGSMSPVARAAVDKRPTISTGGSGYGFGGPASPAGFGIPASPEYESDQSQGDHLLAARDRSKRSPGVFPFTALCWSTVSSHMLLCLFLLSAPRAVAHYGSPVARAAATRGPR